MWSVVDYECLRFDGYLLRIDRYLPGYCYRKNGRLEAAIADFTESIRLNPDNVTAYDERGFALLKMGQHTLAINDFSNSFEMNPLNVKTFVNRGTAHAKAGNYAGAVADYDEALKLDPTNANALHNRAVALTKLDMYQEAVDGFSRLIEIHPDNANAYFCRGSACASFTKCLVALPACTAGCFNCNLCHISGWMLWACTKGPWKITPAPSTWTPVQGH